MGRSPSNSHPETSLLDVCSIGRFSDRAVQYCLVDVLTLDGAKTRRIEDVRRCEKTWVRPRRDDEETTTSRTRDEDKTKTKRRQDEDKTKTG